MYDRSALPSSSCGVGTHRNTTSASAAACAAPITKRSRPAATASDTIAAEPVFDDRDLAGLEPGDLAGIDVGTHDHEPEVGEASARGEPDVARPDHSDRRADPCLGGRRGRRSRIGHRRNATNATSRRRDYWPAAQPCRVPLSPADAHAKMTDMFGAATAGVLGLLDRPATPSLTLAGLVVLGGWLYHVWSEYAARPASVTVTDGADDRRPEPIDGTSLETPAVVALLTNGFRVPASAITATTLDLAARGWVRLAVVDDELVVVTRGQGAPATHSARTSSRCSATSCRGRSTTSARPARWRCRSTGSTAVGGSRFANAVAAHAQSLGLCTRRFEWSAGRAGRDRLRRSD